MTPIRLTALLLSLCLLAPAVPSRASTGLNATCSGSTYAYFNLSVQQGTQVGQCQWLLGGAPGLLMVDIVMYSAPVSKVRFTLPDSPFGTYYGITWNFPHIALVDGRIELDVGCAVGPVVLGTALVFVSGENIPCTTWKVNDDVEVEDCYGELQPTEAPAFQFTSGNDPGPCDDCWQYCEFVPPFGLHPENGATNVPLDTELSFDHPVFQFVPEYLECSIRIGTSPDCSDAQTILVPCDTRTIVLDFLEASTTYYWRAGYLESGGGCSNQLGALSAVHSFTTGLPIAAEKTTWGHVKAMYRD